MPADEEVTSQELADADATADIEHTELTAQPPNALLEVEAQEPHELADDVSARLGAFPRSDDRGCDLERLAGGLAQPRLQVGGSPCRPAPPRRAARPP